MLKRSNEYSLTTLYDKTYLIPFGQKVADQAPAFELNETGVRIWNLLDRDISEEDLFRRFAAENEIPASEQEEAHRDLLDFLNVLMDRGLLADTDADAAWAVAEPFFADLSIAGLTIRLYGDAGYFSKDLLRFAKPAAYADSAASGRPVTEDTDCSDQTIAVTRRSPSPVPGARVVLENEELCVLDAGEDWILFYPSFTSVLQARLSKNGHRCILFLKPEQAFDTSHGNGAKDNDTLRYEVFHAIRLPFLILARRHGFFALHSASIDYKGQALLFSAPSGTGKSTHVRLWEKAGWARQLNGDLNLIGFQDDRPLVYGMPWCGTSGIFTTRTVPLGGIILLRRGCVNRIAAISPDRAALRVSQRLISPVWTEEMLTQNLNFCQKLPSHTMIQELTCTPDLGAAQVVKDKIDSVPGRCPDQKP